MKKYVLGFTLCALLLALAFSAVAQQPKKVPRLAYVDGAGSASVPEEGFKLFDSALRELGYVDGQTIVIERPYAEGH